MLNLNDVRAEGYKIDDDGIVVSPGKFESEHWTTVSLWSLCSDGFADDTIYLPDDPERPISVYTIDRGMREAFPGVFADDTTQILLVEDDQGFVTSREVTQAEYAELLRDPDPEDDGPQEDDLTTEDHERFYSSGYVVLEREHVKRDPDPTDNWYYRDRRTDPLKYLGSFANHEDAVNAYCDRVQYWPNVWYISDHGNAHLMGGNL